MKNFLFIALVLISCKNEISNKEINKINGYWEINKVILNNGEKKEYKVNETIDFISLIQDTNKNQWTGFRQKVMPQFDGSYKTNSIKEILFTSYENGTYFLNYSANGEAWKEEIVEIRDTVLVVKNDESIEYTYKRFRPFSLK